MIQRLEASLQHEKSPGSKSSHSHTFCGKKPAQSPTQWYCYTYVQSRNKKHIVDWHVKSFREEEPLLINQILLLILMIFQWLSLITMYMYLLRMNRHGNSCKTFDFLVNHWLINTNQYQSGMSPRFQVARSTSRQGIKRLHIRISFSSIFLLHVFSSESSLGPHS